jgi:hypothetical protein
MDKNLNLNNDVSRREFIEKAAYSLLGVSALTSTSFGADIPKQNFGKAKRMIIISLNGGCSHVDTFDPKDHPNINGGIKPIQTNGGFTISSYFNELAKHGDKFSLIRGINTKSGAHESASYSMKTSYTKNSLIIHPSMASIIFSLKGSQHGSIPDNILITPDSNHPKSGYLNKQFSPLTITNPLEGLRFSKKTVENSKFNNRLEILKAFDNNFQKIYDNEDVREYHVLYNETLKLMNSKDLELFDLNKESEATKERYGKTQFGQGVLLAYRLLKNNIRAVEVGSSSFDFHNDINTGMTTKTGEIDKAMSALFTDLAKDKLLDDTLVLITTEFGRTSCYATAGKSIEKIDEVSPRNVNDGRDHQPAAFSALIGGCGMYGKVVGKTNEFANKVIDRPVSVGEINATIGALFGIKPDYVWMSPPNSSAPNRPFTVGNKSDYIHELVG